MRKWRPVDRPANEDWWVRSQVVVPLKFREEVMQLAHATPMAGHLGVRKTLERILRHFYWPQVRKDVVHFCRSCHDWDVAMPFLLFAIRDAVNESTGFSPFELVYGHEVRSPLRMVKERLVTCQVKGDVLQYVATFKARLGAAWQVACNKLAGAKERMKRQFDRKAVSRSFAVGDRVLMLLPWCRHNQRMRVRICTPPPEPVSARVENTRALEQLGKQLSHLTTVQRQDVLELVASHPVLFKDRPGLTPLAIHDVETASAEAIKQHPYRFPPRKKKQVAEEAFRCPMPECFTGA
ncbi:hypothetical protein SKAU_G00035480 [Synaphobranchus kaupii]|uniref:Gypsy retrotransposon integrase-like protein 1 n=1 Tax=Synaphobranchus kaupii TaxID=118154 RepID=A0A9Q1JFU0_SYNKA|nr:hypothetical protein SKAU_G00035480 [Synaphobranchus kaupii]